MATTTAHHHHNSCGTGNITSDGCPVNGGSNSTPQQFCLKWNNYSSNLVKSFGKMIMDQNFVDVTLACEGSAIKAHKAVLASCSNYFKELFLANPCKHPIVILKDIKMDDLKAIVDFMYKGEVNVFNHQLTALLKTAQILKVKGLTETKDDEEEESNIPENTPATASNLNANNCNVNPSNSAINDLDKSGNISYGGRLLAADRHPESLVNSHNQATPIASQPKSPPPPPPPMQSQAHQFHHQINNQSIPHPPPQTLPPLTPLHPHQEQNHQIQSSLSSSSSSSSTSSQSQALEGFKNLPQSQKTCQPGRKKRRRRSKRVSDGTGADRGGESDSGSIISGDEETLLPKERKLIEKTSTPKKLEDLTSTSTTGSMTTSSDPNNSSAAIPGNSNLQQQESNHSLSNSKKKLPLPPILQNVPTAPNQEMVANSNFGHVDNSSEPWHEEEQVNMSENMEDDDESNGVMNIQPIVSFDEGSGGESMSDSLPIPQDSTTVSQVDFESHSRGSTGNSSQGYRYSGQKCVCDTCNLTFTAYSSLRRHKERHLSDRKRYDCDICFKSYSRKDYLKEHRKNKHQM